MTTRSGSLEQRTLADLLTPQRVAEVLKVPMRGDVAGRSGGGGGIRTHGPRLEGHGLANRCLGPLGHPSDFNAPLS
jgi:hypothetical protein